MESLSLSDRSRLDLPFVARMMMGSGLLGRRSGKSFAVVDCSLGSNATGHVGFSLLEREVRYEIGSVGRYCFCHLTSFLC